MLKDDASIQENAFLILTAQEVDNVRSRFVKEIEVFLEQALQKQATWTLSQYSGHLAHETAENVGLGVAVAVIGVGWTVIIVTLPITLPVHLIAEYSGYNNRRDQY